MRDGRVRRISSGANDEQACEFQHIRRVLFDVEFELSDLLPVAEAAGKEFKLFGISRRHREVSCISADHAEGIDDPSEKSVRISRSNSIVPRDHSMRRQCLECLARVRGSE